MTRSWALPRGTYGAISAGPKPGRTSYTATSWTHQRDGRRCSVSRTGPTPHEAVERLCQHLRGLGLVDGREGTSAGSRWPVSDDEAVAA